MLMNKCLVTLKSYSYDTWYDLPFTTQSFNDPEKLSLLKTYWKKGKKTADNQWVFPFFSTMFSSISKTDDISNS